MDYREAIQYLADLTKFGYNFGLDRITHLMGLLGNPHHRLRFIHVGGTNGKGSTSVMIASILQAAGYRTGLFTSPHLHSYTERTKINGCDIPQDRVAGLIKRLRPLLEQMVAEGHEHPTEFEVNTALSLVYFAEEEVDFAVLEVGLGGAIDSTNVIPLPLAAVITNVGLDHMEYLGNTVGEIAQVKAGIIKPGGLVVTAARHPEALRAIKEKCDQEHASLYSVDDLMAWEEIKADSNGILFNLKGLNGLYEELFLPLVGRHQLINAATAVLTIEVLGKRGVQITSEAIRHGLALTRWPARLEVFGHSPAILIDVAHNYDGALTLQKALVEFFRYKRLILLIGMLADKEREKVMGLLAPLAHSVVVTKPLSPRAGDWQEMGRMAASFTDSVFLEEDVRLALDKAISLAGPDDLVCATGSFYTIAEIRSLLAERK
ncbi:MAG: bifunctional folylpolyglutamate synthase/dihydrofolate synthase [Bacillota bacterium]